MKRIPFVFCSSFFVLCSSFFVLCCSFFVLPSCTPKPTEQQFVDDAMRAVGGRAKVEAVKSIVIEGTGVNYNLGQDLTPGAATQQFDISNYKRHIDLAQ